jgi:alkylhydroperoxidase/carboxymuconolactone decarboxylase family protein YurZ
MAELHGVSEAEIQEAAHLAKFTSGWSTYLNGRMYDEDTYVKELHDIGEYVAAQHAN